MQKIKYYLGSQKTTNILLIILILVLMTGFYKMTKMQKKMYRSSQKSKMMQMHKNMNAYEPQYNPMMYMESVPTEPYIDQIPPEMMY